MDNWDCLAEALSGNNWATEEELKAGDLRGRLEEQLSRFARIEKCFTSHPRRLDGEVHTKQELRMRSVEGEGGLCALAAYYQAFYHTFLSRLLITLIL